MKNIFLLYILLIGSNNLDAQISGFVYDSKTRSPIEGVFVFVKHKSFSTITDKSGYFSIKEGIQKKDTVYFTIVDYTHQYLTNIVPSDSLCVYLENTEDIDSVVVTYKKERRKRQKLGDLRKPFIGILGMFSNTNFSLCYKETPMVSYINNPKNKKGQIDKILIKFVNRKSKILATNLTNGANESYYLKDPEYIKLEILCIQVSDNQEPLKPIVNEPIIFTIDSYITQWLDISKYQVPFPENGIFVGMKILEVKGEDGWGEVSVPLLYSTKEKNDMFYEYQGKWFLKNNTINVYGKKNRYTYGFGIEVSYEN